MRTFLALLTVFCLALSGWGCGASANTVMEADRHLLAQTDQATTIAQAQIEMAIALLSFNPAKVVEAIEALEKARPPLSDVKANTGQLVKNYGAPNDPTKPWSPEESKAKREQSEKEHAGGGFWGWLVGGIGVALAGLKLAATYIPGVAKFFAGPWGAVAETGVAFIDNLKRQGKVTAADLEYLKKLQEDARVQPFVKELAKKFEATVGPSTEAGPPA
jgi:hypothetical protein